MISRSISYCCALIICPRFCIFPILITWITSYSLPALGVLLCMFFFVFMISRASFSTVKFKKIVFHLCALLSMFNPLVRIVAPKTQHSLLIAFGGHCCTKSFKILQTHLLLFILPLLFLLFGHCFQLSRYLRICNFATFAVVHLED